MWLQMHIYHLLQKLKLMLILIKLPKLSQLKIIGLGFSCADRLYICES